MKNKNSGDVIKKKKKILLKLKKILSETLDKKIKIYSAETEYNPFIRAIAGEKRQLESSFVHSLYTTFGMSVWEQFTKCIGEAVGLKIIRQYEIPYSISLDTDTKINQLHQNLERKKIFNNTEEIAKQIKAIAKPGSENIEDEDKIVDIFIEDSEKNLTFIDITSPKPNIKECKAMKLKLLRWIAIGHANYKDAKSIKAILCMPFNPWYPKKYNHFPVNKVFDIENDLRIQNKFWDSIAGFEIYDEIIDIFEKVGKIKIKKITKKLKNL